MYIQALQSGGCEQTNLQTTGELELPILMPYFHLNVLGSHKRYKESFWDQINYRNDMEYKFGQI